MNRIYLDQLAPSKAPAATITVKRKLSKLAKQPDEQSSALLAQLPKLAAPQELAGNVFYVLAQPREVEQLFGLTDSSYFVIRNSIIRDNLGRSPDIAFGYGGEAHRLAVLLNSKLRRLKADFDNQLDGFVEQTYLVNGALPSLNQFACVSTVRAKLLKAFQANSEAEIFLLGKRRQANYYQRLEQALLSVNIRSFSKASLYFWRGKLPRVEKLTASPAMLDGILKKANLDNDAKFLTNGGKTITFKKVIVTCKG